MHKYIIPEKSEAWKLEATNWVRDEGYTVYPYSLYPLIEFPINRERWALLRRHKRELIDTARQASYPKSANEVDPLQRSALAFPGKVGPEIARKIRR